MEALNLKIMELEAQLRMKDEHIKLLNEKIEFLNLKQMTNNVEQQELICRKIVKPKKIIKETTYINIQDFFKTYISNTETRYTYRFQNKNQTAKFIALKPEYYKKQGHISMIKATIDVISDAINKLPKNTSFYKICDKSRKKIEIKSNGEFLSTSKNEVEIDDLILKLFRDTSFFLVGSFNEFNYYFSNRRIKLSEEEKEICSKAFNKRFVGDELTDQEMSLIKKQNVNDKIFSEFKEITGVDYELLHSSKGWFDVRAVEIYGFDDYKKGANKLKKFLITGIKDIEETKLKEDEEDEEDDKDTENFESDEQDYN